MYQEDTCNLLKECNAGIKMAVDALSEVLPNVKEEALKRELTKNKEEHAKLGDETHQLLSMHHKEDEEPNAIAKGMSWMKTNMKMSMNPGDDTIADLIISGCDMGVRSLCKYLNKYTNASEEAKKIANNVISLEENLSKSLRNYL